MANKVITHIFRKIRKHYMIGNTVTAELTLYDLEKDRIIYRTR